MENPATAKETIALLKKFLSPKEIIPAILVNIYGDVSQIVDCHHEHTLEEALEMFEDRFGMTEEYRTAITVAFVLASKQKAFLESYNNLAA